MKTLKYRIAAWLGFAAMLFVTLSPIEMRPGDIFNVDVDRALAFGLLAAMFMVAYPRHALFVGGMIVLSAGAIELLQALSPTRHARLDDAIIKGSGALGGMLVAEAYTTLRRWRHARRRGPLVLADLPVVQTEAGTSALKLPVTSSMIDQVYFSPADGQLRLKLRNGEEVTFAGVDETAASELATAPSPGIYYLQNIRNKFPRKAA